MLNSACFSFMSSSPPPPRECYWVNQGSQRDLFPCSCECTLSLCWNWEQCSVQLFLIFGRTDCFCVFALSQEINSQVCFSLFMFEVLSGCTWASQQRVRMAAVSCTGKRKNGIHLKRGRKTLASQGPRKRLIVKTFTHVKAIKTKQNNQDVSPCLLSLVSLSTPLLKPVPDRMFV